MWTERFASQGLGGGEPARDPVAVVRRLLAVQGQDPRGFRLAIRARSAGLTAADVDQALGEDRTLVVAWLCRGTLHLVAREDFAWLHALTTPQLRTGVARRLAQEGVDPATAQRGAALLERTLADDGPQRRDELRDRLAAAGVPTAGQAVPQLLLHTSLRGTIVRGPDAGRSFAHTEHWLGPQRPVDRDAALTELGRRYLAGHAPAADRDLAKWAGLPLRDARRALAHARDGGNAPMAGASVRSTPLKLLGAFDPVLLGWADRGDLLGEHAGKVTAGGLFRPFVLAGGRAAGTWRLDAGRVRVEPLAPLDAAAVEREAADVERFLGARTGSARAAR